MIMMINYGIWIHKRRSKIKNKKKKKDFRLQIQTYKAILKKKENNKLNERLKINEFILFIFCMLRNNDAIQWQRGWWLYDYMMTK